jgi:hypothetical protein
LATTVSRSGFGRVATAVSGVGDGNTTTELMGRTVDAQLHWCAA